jgi:2-polyprenyl-3-methyl-5-hydroxy-6-metoxy-1,4-benzoquinol methylase
MEIDPQRAPAEADLEPGVDFFCGAQSQPREVWRAGALRFVRCARCGLVYADPRLTAEARAREVYTEAYHAPRAVSPPLRRLKRLKRILLSAIKPPERYERRLWVVERHAPAGALALLDVGCWTGEFVAWLQRRRPHWRVQGLEPVESAARMARERHGAKVTTGSLTDCPFAAGSLDVVTMWHVLEHLDDPPAAVSGARRLLKPGGLLALRTPNYGSLYRRLYGGRWRGYRAGEHLYLFTVPTLRRLLEASGFELLEPRGLALSARLASSTYVIARPAPAADAP